MSLQQNLQSIPIIYHLFENLLEIVWAGIAEKNVQRMAPKAISVDVAQTIKSFVLMSHTEKYVKKNTFQNESDPKPLEYDNLSYGCIELDENVLKLENVSERKITVTSQVSQIKRKLSFRDSKFKEVESPKKANSINKNQTSLIQIESKKNQDQTVSDPLVEEKHRNIILEREKEDFAMKKMIEKKSKQSQEMRQKNEKVLKDKKHFTFDYEGAYFGVNALNLQGQKVIKLKQVFGLNKVAGKEYKTIEASKIESDRKDNRMRSLLSQKDIPIFSEKKLLITDLFKEENISEGIKLTEIGANSSAIKEKKRKQLEGIRAFRLKDFKNYSKDLSFKEYSRSGSNSKPAGSSILNFSQSECENKQEIIENQIKNKQKSRQNSSKSGSIKAPEENILLEKALGRGLPFIRTKGYKMHDLASSRSLKESEISFLNKSKKIKRQRSKIVIDNSNLFDDNFMI